MKMESASGKRKEGGERPKPWGRSEENWNHFVTENL
jgi:hypothetical protein